MEWVTGIISFIWNNKIIIPLLAALSHATVVAIDVFLINGIYKEEGGIYKDEYDGIIISALFQGIVLVAIPLTGIQFPYYKITVLAILSGLLYSIMLSFYFKAMFIEDDGAIIETFLNLIMVVVPVLTFCFGIEQLSLTQWLGMGVAFLGANVPAVHSGIRKASFYKVFKLMIPAVLFFSLSMVSQDIIYENVNFLTGYYLFSLGVMLGGFYFFLVRDGFGSVKKKSKDLFNLSRKNFFLFLGAELVSLCGVSFSQRAIDVNSPDVSVVTIFESFQPMFVMFVAVMIFSLSWILGIRNEKINSMCRDQVRGWWIKIVAMSVMTVGIILFINNK